MKTNGYMIAITLVLMLVLSYQPPKTVYSQGVMKKVVVIIPVDSVMAKRDIKILLDSVKVISDKVDSLTDRCKKRLPLIKLQQRQLDTLTTLTKNNE